MRNPEPGDQGAETTTPGLDEPMPDPGTDPEPEEQLVYIDTSSWSPADLVLYPAISSVTFLNLPMVKECLDFLQAAIAGQSMADLRWGGEYSHLHEDYHPTLQELSGGNFLLALAAVLLDLRYLKPSRTRKNPVPLWRHGW